MWSMSSSATRELARSHTAVARVDVLHAGKAAYTLEVTGGSVNAEAGRSVFRNLQSCTIVDPDGSFSTGDVGDPLDPYSCEIQVWRGVLIPGPPVTTNTTTLTAGFGLQPFGTSGFGGTQVVSSTTTSMVAEWAPLGVFGLTSREVNGDGTVTLTGQDRAMGYQGPMTGSLAIPAATPIEDAIIRLLATRNPGVVFAQTWKTGFMVGPLLFSPDIDVWAEAQSLAQSVGGWLYHDRMGGLVFASVLPTGSPVARYAAGEGTGLIGVKRSEDSDTIHNVVVVESAKTATGGVITATAEDTDPASPTYSRGRYGRRPVTLTNQHIGGVQQAQQMAATQLVRELGRSETASMEVVVDPRLDPLDLIVVHRPTAGLVNRGMAIAATDVPLAADATMAINLQKSIRAQDGTILENPEAA